MSAPERSLQEFLQRWSRRKLGLEEQPNEQRPAETEQTKPAEAHELGAPSSASESSDASVESAVEPFDLARLPSIESIDASTDIRPFLAAGIPAELARAALRRAWLSDPAIRDFVGIAENQWDFNNPDTVPGFGSLEFTPELRRRAAELFGESSARSAEFRDSAPSPGLATVTSAKMADSDTPTASMPDSASAPAVAAMPTAGADGALQNDLTADETVPVPSPPKHGGALPK